jgi:outer membrane lipoprotein SlyB
MTRFTVLVAGGLLLAAAGCGPTTTVTDAQLRCAGGATAGGLAGGLLGSRVGSGTGRTAATVVGAGAGALAGGAAAC